MGCAPPRLSVPDRNVLARLGGLKSATRGIRRPWSENGEKIMAETWGQKHFSAPMFLPLFCCFWTVRAGSYLLAHHLAPATNSTGADQWLQRWVMSFMRTRTR